MEYPVLKFFGSCLCNFNSDCKLVLFLVQSDDVGILVTIPSRIDKVKNCCIFWHIRLIFARDFSVGELYIDISSVVDPDPAFQVNPDPGVLMTKYWKNIQIKKCFDQKLLFIDT